MSERIYLEQSDSSESREKEKIITQDDAYRATRLDLESFMHLYEIEIDKVRNLDEQREELTREIGADLFNVLSQKLLEMAELCYKDDYNIYMAFKYFELLGLKDRIIERINHGIRNKNGQVCYDLFRATCKYGSEEQIKNATDTYVKEEGIYAIEDMPYFRERFQEITATVNKYSQFYNLPVGFAITSEIFNAAMEIKKRDYDLAIGVLRSGAPIAVMLEIMGMETKYLEWSRKWKKGPIWRKIGRDRDVEVEIEKPGKKIIVCEHDTYTGTTLKAIAPLIKKLEPQSIDVCFWIDAHHTNKEILKNADDYGAGYNAGDFPQEDFFENLQNFLNVIRSKEFAKFVDK